MKYHFIINPVAGKHDSSKTLVPEIHHAAKACGIPEEQLTIQLTNRPSHAHYLALEAVKAAEAADEEIRIYAAGGDGTFNEVLTGAMNYKKAAVGLLPYGSGNDFLRSFGVREEFCDVEDQLRGSVKEIDMIKTQRGYAAAICSAGLDAKVAYGIPKFRRLPVCGGEMAYKLSILQVLMGKKATRLHINIDGKEFERSCMLAAVCNGHAYGGGFLAAPESKLDDGILDVMVIKEISLLKIAKVLPIYQAGKHFKNGQVVPELRDIVEYYPARCVQIRPVDSNQDMIVNVDGECGPDKILTAEMVPLSARIILPKKVAERQ
ncbi:MAG: YegS/Rv2252/BmrU family lipid kinase [Lachnospiraceae bacterium]|nr:YegS/Rv2252/BmrU family lipid kinase [Lachnospiraceae bacterium]